MRTAERQQPRMRLHFEIAAATVVACTIFCLATTTFAQQPTAKTQGYTEVQRLTGGIRFQNLTISSDGSSALGYLCTETFCNLNRWSKTGGSEEVGVIKGHYVTPQAVSPDGTVVAGTFYITKNILGYPYLFRWSKSGGLKIIGMGEKTLPLTVAYVSDDASTVIWQGGWKVNKRLASHLIRRSKGEKTQDLGEMADFAVKGVSADGSVVVGEARTNGVYHGFRWTEEGGLKEFAEMDRPLGLSADGSVMLGTKGEHVIRWTQAGGAQDLGTLKTDGKTIARPERASVDGAVIVGWLEPQTHENPPSTPHAFLWTKASGVWDLGSMRGQSTRLEGVSSDAKVVAGYFVDDIGASVQFVWPVADLTAKSEAELRQDQARAQAQTAAQTQQQAKAAAAQAEERAKKAAIEADQQARYNRVIKTGRPAQIYSLAGDLQEEGRPDLAGNLYQALIDKFPDDPYTAKAIDKKEAAREAAAQQQQAQGTAAQSAASTAASLQASEACRQQCSTTLRSCKSDAQNQQASAVAKGLVGLLYKNSATVSTASVDAQTADGASSACEDAYNSCSAACQ
jgi:probable HAF family extracellular repeat protein